MTISTARVVLIPVKLPDDEQFLEQIYFCSRQEDLALWSSALGEDQAKNLLKMQYRGQKNQYLADFPSADHDIIVFDEIPVGRFLTARNEREIRGVDLSILPEYRNLGIGTFLFENSFKEASETNRSFVFRVLKTNRALRLYQRLGCRIVTDEGSHYAMEWRKP